jgi:osmotically inducible lipoprotein OsmB
MRRQDAIAELGRQPARAAKEPRIELDVTQDKPNLEIAMLAIRYAALAAALLLAACGSSKTDRGLSGGAIGAGTGAALGAVTGTSTLGGAVLGGAAGAATGVLTDEDDVDLGEPIWK